MCFGKIRLENEHLFESREGCLQFALRPQYVGKIVVSNEVIGLEDHRPLIVRRRLVELALILEDVA